jgi:hypothetical protein
MATSINGQGTTNYTYDAAHHLTSGERCGIAGTVRSAG